MVMKLGELETPYMKGSTFYNKHSIKCVGIKDREGFDAFDCYADDADEILKRINGYEQLQATNKQLLEALEEMAADYEAQINAEYTEENLIYPSYKRRYDADMETLKKAQKAITNAKQMGDKG